MTPFRSRDLFGYLASWPNGASCSIGEVQVIGISCGTEYGASLESKRMNYNPGGKYLRVVQATEKANSGTSETRGQIGMVIKRRKKASWILKEERKPFVEEPAFAGAIHT